MSNDDHAADPFPDLAAVPEQDLPAEPGAARPRVADSAPPAAPARPLAGLPMGPPSAPPLPAHQQPTGTVALPVGLETSVAAPPGDQAGVDRAARPVGHEPLTASQWPRAQTPPAGPDESSPAPGPLAATPLPPTDGPAAPQHDAPTAATEMLPAAEPASPAPAAPLPAALAAPPASSGPPQVGPGAASTDHPAAGTDAAPETATRAAVRTSKKRPGSFLKELPVLVIIALALAILIKAFVVQAFYIPSGSMEQTLALNDRVLVNKVVYHLRDIKRGEVIVFNGEGSFGTNPEVAVTAPGNVFQQATRAVGRIIGFGPPGERDFIKRVIGVPGDRVACCVDGHVTVQPAGGLPVALTEPYVFEDDRAEFCAAGSGPAQCPSGSPGVLIPAGRLWVMGDHRGASSDSRLHRSIHDGTVPQDKVIGRAFVIVWPLGRFTGLHRPATFADRRLAAAGAVGLGVSPYLLGAALTFPVAGLRRRRRTARLAL